MRQFAGAKGAVSHASQNGCPDGSAVRYRFDDASCTVACQRLLDRVATTRSGGMSSRHRAPACKHGLNDLSACAACRNRQPLSAPFFTGWPAPFHCAERLAVLLWVLSVGGPVASALSHTLRKAAPQAPAASGHSRSCCSSFTKWKGSSSKVTHSRSGVIGDGAGRADAWPAALYARVPAKQSASRSSTREHAEAADGIA